MQPDQIIATLENHIENLFAKLEVNEAEPDEMKTEGRTLIIDTLYPEGRTLDLIMNYFGSQDIDIMEYTMTLKMTQDEDGNFHHIIRLDINDMEG